MMVQSRQRLDLLQLALGLRTVNKDRDGEEEAQPRAQQPNDFSNLLNTQYAQALSVLPRQNQKPRVPPKPPAKREQSNREQRENGQQQPGQQRLSAWA